MPALILPNSSSQTREHAKILIIDDEPNVSSILYSLLADRHECKTASCAAEALELLKEEEFDLILSDIMMPGMSGLELLEKIKRLKIARRLS